MTGVSHHAQPFVEIGGLMSFLLWLASSHDPPDLCLLSSQDYRLEPVNPVDKHIFNHDKYSNIGMENPYK
jgi:hypothetical protein